MPFETDMQSVPVIQQKLCCYAGNSKLTSITLYFCFLKSLGDVAKLCKLNESLTCHSCQLHASVRSFPTKLSTIRFSSKFKYPKPLLIYDCTSLCGKHILTISIKSIFTPRYHCLVCTQKIWTFVQLFISQKKNITFKALWHLSGQTTWAFLCAWFFQNVEKVLRANR